MRLILALAFLALLVPTAAAREFEEIVYLHEYADGLHITPKQINAQAGDVIRMTVINQGQGLHNLKVCADEGQSPSAPPRDCERLGAFTRNLIANESAPAVFTVPGSSAYWYYCDIPGHTEGGMAGTILVASDAGGTKESGSGVVLGALAGLAAAAVLARRHA